MLNIHDSLIVLSLLLFFLVLEYLQSCEVLLAQGIQVGHTYVGIRVLPLSPEIPGLDVQPSAR